MGTSARRHSIARVASRAIASAMALLASCTATLDLGNTAGPPPVAGDAAAHVGISLRVGVARQRRMPNTSEPLVLLATLSNEPGGAELRLDPALFSLQLASGARVAPRSAVPRAQEAPWVAGVPPATGATLAAAGTFASWPLAFDLDAYQDAPTSLHYATSSAQEQEVRRASSPVTLQPCSSCDAECTYLESDPQHCGECNLAYETCENGGPHRWQVVSSGAMDAGLSVWANSRSDVWAGGSKGQILHWDGALWTRFSVTTTNPIKRLWGSGPNDIWGVGGFGKFDANLVHWDGASWSTVASGVNEELNAIWGSGPSDVWAVGYASNTAHWDGARWFVSYSEANGYLYGIHGTSARDIWVVGQAGLIRRWDGRAWNDVDSGTNENLFGVWASGQNDAWAVGDHATVLHWNGRKWGRVAVPVPVDVMFAGVEGSGAGDVWAVGDQGKMIHWNGAAWSKVAMPVSAANLVGITTRDGQAWAVGHYGTASSAEVFTY